MIYRARQKKTDEQTKCKSPPKKTNPTTDEQTKRKPTKLSIKLKIENYWDTPEGTTVRLTPFAILLLKSEDNNIWG